LKSLPCLLLLVTCATPACLSSSPPPAIDYYRVDLPDGEPRLSGPAGALRLRHVRAAAHIKERMIWRESGVEVGYSETQRWIEPPVDYLARAVTGALFHRDGWVQADSAPLTLDLTLVAFDEVLAPEHVAEVVLEARLARNGDTLLDERIVRRTPIESPTSADFARAIGASLKEAADDLAAHLQDALQP